MQFNVVPKGKRGRRVPRIYEKNVADDAWASYVLSSYMFNPILRAGLDIPEVMARAKLPRGHGATLADRVRYIRVLKESLASGDRVPPEGMTVWRGGFPKSQLGKMDRGFVSTTTDYDVAYDFLLPFQGVDGFGKDAVIACIFVPGGTPIKDMRIFKRHDADGTAQQEIVLPPGIIHASSCTDGCKESRMTNYYYPHETVCATFELAERWMEPGAGLPPPDPRSTSAFDWETPGGFDKNLSLLLAEMSDEFRKQSGMKHKYNMDAARDGPRRFVPIFNGLHLL